MEQQPNHEQSRDERIADELGQIQDLSNTIAQRMVDNEEDFAALETRIRNIEHMLNGEPLEEVQMTADETRAYVEDIHRKAIAAIEAGEPEASVRERFGIGGGMPLTNLIDMPGK